MGTNLMHPTVLVDLSKIRKVSRNIIEGFVFAGFECLFFKSRYDLFWDSTRVYFVNSRIILFYGL
jgi:hypothetical protein